MNSEIITIGDEILIGQVIDTNSAFLAAELNRLGISVTRITSVADTRESIIKAFDEAALRADLIISTGGLGPTSDDITKHTLTEYFGTKLVLVPSVIEKIKNLLASRGVEMNELNRKQAELPESCEILPNSAGTAQGMWFKKKGKDFISLPGVPYEMKAIFREQMETRFRQRFTLPVIHHITVLTHGIPESEMAGRLHDWEAGLPDNMKLAYLPSPGLLRLRITGRSNNDPDSLKTNMESEVEKLQLIVGDNIFGYNEDRLEVIIGKLLKENNLTLSVTESCTGGMISLLITSVPGSSVYYKGGIVAYSNEIKTAELNVSPYTLLVNGAVSQAVVEQMADGIRNRYQSDFSVAVSGIAGPTGGTEEKPVGTTWIAVASKKRIATHIHNFGEDRGRNMQKAANAALFMLWKEIKDCL